MASDAKDRILESATGIFARKGYRDATIAEVCEAAEANIAGVNYHFGSKENLFRQVLRHAFDTADRRYPIDGDLPSGAPAEERLRAFMSALIRRGFDNGPAGHFNRILTHHVTRESAPDEIVMKEVVRLEGRVINAILQDLLKTRSEGLIANARIDVLALSVFPSLAPRVRKSLFDGNPTTAQVNRFVDRQFRFALAGLRALNSKAKEPA